MSDNLQSQPDPVTTGLIDAFQKSVLVERWIREVWDLASTEVKSAFASRVVEIVGKSWDSYAARERIDRVIADEVAVVATARAAEIRATAEKAVSAKLANLEDIVTREVDGLLKRAVREVFAKVSIP